MDRREMLLTSAALGISGLALGRLGRANAAPAGSAGTLLAPANGSIPVAVVLSAGAVVIDFCGPWEVFQSTRVIGRRDAAFSLYTVAEKPGALTVGGGMKIQPNYTFDNAPAPKVVVIPAQAGAGDAALNWIRKVTRQTDVTMSVCTGAYILARTGLLQGLSATTHHSSYADFAMQFPGVHVVRGARFVESGNLASSGGLSSGIDLSLRVVERYFGREAAMRTAYYMEYQGMGWMDPNSNSDYRTPRQSATNHPICPVCDMDVDIASAPHSLFRDTTYYFCSTAHQIAFDKSPELYLDDGY